jgi:hypothetical protein
MCKEIVWLFLMQTKNDVIQGAKMTSPGVKLTAKVNKTG